MEKPLIYCLSNPGYTIYHRAALGGLAGTVRAWGRSPPDGIKAELTHDTVTLDWPDEIGEREAVRRILAASFKLTKDDMIDLPAQGLAAGAEDLRLAIHNALTMTFLQHNKMRPPPKGRESVRHFVLRGADDEVGQPLPYKPVGSYAHQTAQKTGLLKETRKKGSAEPGQLPKFGSIPQWSVPGAMSGATDLQAPCEDVVLLAFLMAACPVFILRSWRREQKAQYCVVVPDVSNLEGFARSLQRLALRGPGFTRFTNTYLGRVVGGSEEAAMRFLLELEGDEIKEKPSVRGCLAVAMGKVAWDKNQINRSGIIHIGATYPELNVFRAANTELGRSHFLTTDKGEAFAVPNSRVPELIAANLAWGRHWCDHFTALVKDKKHFLQMSFHRRGLMAMKQAVKNEDDRAIIAAIQDAWNMTMGALGDRARRDGLDFGRLVEVERERIRNAILRTKTADALASWFLRFCADATKGASLAAIRQDPKRIREFIFNPRYFDRFQNLCLFALLSYVGDSEQAKERSS